MSKVLRPAMDLAENLKSQKALKQELGMPFHAFFLGHLELLLYDIRGA